jgi:hypothetical protein
MLIFIHDAIFILPKTRADQMKPFCDIKGWVGGWGSVDINLIPGIGSVDRSLDGGKVSAEAWVIAYGPGVLGIALLTTCCNYNANGKTDVLAT